MNKFHLIVKITLILDIRFILPYFADKNKRTDIIVYEQYLRFTF